MGQGMEGFEEELRALKATYAEQVPEKLAQIDELWGALVEWGWQDETFKTLHRTVHSMAGSAPVFGFSAMGERARELEVRLKAVVADGEPLTEKDYQEIPLLVQAVHSAAQAPDDG